MIVDTKVSLGDILEKEGHQFYVKRIIIDATLLPYTSEYKVVVIATDGNYYLLNPSSNKQNIVEVACEFMKPVYKSFRELFDGKVRKAGYIVGSRTIITESISHSLYLITTPNLQETFYVPITNLRYLDNLEYTEQFKKAYGRFL